MGGDRFQNPHSTQDRRFVEIFHWVSHVKMIRRCCMDDEIRGWLNLHSLFFQVSNSAISVRIFLRGRLASSKAPLFVISSTITYESRLFGISGYNERIFVALTIERTVKTTPKLRISVMSDVQNRLWQKPYPRSSNNIKMWEPIKPLPPV